MSAPRVYAAISAVTAELASSGIAKRHVNSEEHYAYRGIDDVMTRLAPLLARHRLCILPRVLERIACERRGAGNELLVNVALKVAFDFVSARDGSCHTVEACGEALDNGDKATSKAMSAAFKQAVLQAFCIPVEASEDADATTHRLKAHAEPPDPDQGWEQWSRDMADMIGICESSEALERVQHTYRALLRAASKRRPDVYAAIGEAMRTRREALRPALPPASASHPQRKGNGKVEEVAHA